MKGETIHTLSGGFARLVDSMGDDLSIVRAARVSYNADWRVSEEANDEKLIGYLMKNHHTSPFEAVSFTFEIQAPIFVFRQWHRHRTWSYNEISARYTELDLGFYVPMPGNYGTQSKHNKQVRDIASKAFGVDEIVVDRELAWEKEQRDHMDSAFVLYKKHIAEGMPRELARIVLPFATYSRMFASIDLHNLYHFLRLRLHSHSQYEIRVYAEALLNFARQVAPVATKAFENTL